MDGFNKKWCLKEALAHVENDQLCFPCTVYGEDICLIWTLRCDGQSHCDEGIDEVFETCYGDSCVRELPAFRRCDGEKDCMDGRDEYYDGCHDDGKYMVFYSNVFIFPLQGLEQIFYLKFKFSVVRQIKMSVSAFGNTSVAVAVMFLISVVVVLIGLVFCICCCCRGNRGSRPRSSNTPAMKNGTVNGYRFVSHSCPMPSHDSFDGSVTYDVSDDSVQISTA
ncbi:uncharacterized protein LOC144353320 [Saccoglossus kowalevskii]